MEQVKTTGVKPYMHQTRYKAQWRHLFAFNDLSDS